MIVPLKALGDRLLHSTRTALLVNLLALVLLAYSLSQWVWRVLPLPVDPTPAVADTPPSAYPDPQTMRAAARLFGNALKESTEALEALAVSSLELVLSGVIVRRGESLAVLSVQGQPEQPFAVGAEVLPGVVLQAVWPDRIVIRRRDGAREFVLLKESSSAAPSSPPSQPVLPQTPSSSTLAPTMPAAGTAILKADSPSANRATAVATTSPIAQRALPFEPAPQGGLLVRELPPGSLYERLGLRHGDVIKSVNGQAIHGLEQAYGVLLHTDHRGSSALELEVIRAGQMLKLRLSAP